VYAPLVGEPLFVLPERDLVQDFVVRRVLVLIRGKRDARGEQKRILCDQLNRLYMMGNGSDLLRLSPIECDLVERTFVHAFFFTLFPLGQEQDCRAIRVPNKWAILPGCRQVAGAA